jgi:hypothetical protein
LRVLHGKATRTVYTQACRSEMTGLLGPFACLGHFTNVYQHATIVTEKVERKLLTFALWFRSSARYELVEKLEKVEEATLVKNKLLSEYFLWADSTLPLIGNLTNSLHYASSSSPPILVVTLYIGAVYSIRRTFNLLLMPRRDARPSDERCSICYTPFGALLAEEEMMLAMDTPGASERALGVTRLQRCGHYFCRKEYVFPSLSIHPSIRLLAREPNNDRN